MGLRTASEEDVDGFVECYLDVWRSLRGILPDDYVNGQIENASCADFKGKMSSEISDPDSIILVAEEGSETVGIAWGNLKEDGSAWLIFLGVSPEHRRKGVGTSLLIRFIKLSRKMGSVKVALDTDPRLIPAIRLYERMGFTAEGVTKNPYGLELVIYGRAT
jgi:ribosomal protein S18 acetylase RimI-like enzyme